MEIWKPYILHPVVKIHKISYAGYALQCFENSLLFWKQLTLSNSDQLVLSSVHKKAAVTQWQDSIFTQLASGPDFGSVVAILYAAHVPEKLQ